MLAVTRVTFAPAMLLIDLDQLDQRRCPVWTIFWRQIRVQIGVATRLPSILQTLSGLRHGVSDSLIWHGFTHPAP